MKYLILVLVAFSQWASAAPREIDAYHWTGVERIVAIGDIHGDYAQYMATLEAAGLVNAKGKWTGGQAHLVQNGDVPDRGPDSAKIIRHLAKLTKEASKSGGQVHALIGNHEAMNVYGDLRYVSAGEYAAFVTRNSAKLRDRYYEAVMQDLEKRDPEKFSGLPEGYRQEWDAAHPLGWVEHRQAWDPAWNPKGEFWLWVQERKVAVQINDLVFLHGGLSGFYCQNTLQSLTDKVIAGLRAYDPANPGILEDEFGPLWYRGMSGEKPEASAETVQAILQQQGARHVVVGHTPTSGIVWPRYQGQVIQIDTGISAAYGGHLGYLEVTPEGLFAGYSNGKVALPADDAGRVAYLEQVIALDPGNTHLKELLASLNAPPAATGPGSAAPGSAETGSSETASAAPGASDAGATNPDQGPMATDIGAAAATHAPGQAATIPTCGISE